MDKNLEKSEIIRLIREVAEKDGDTPGQKRFATATGIKGHVWRGRLWRSWSDVLVEAGFDAKDRTTFVPEDRIYEAVEQLAHRLARFPNSTDLQFERSNDANFPSSVTIRRRMSMLELAQALRKRAVASGDDTLTNYCESYLSNASTDEPSTAAPTIEPVGYVYLIRYRQYFKIGRTSSINRRAREVQIELPEATILIHAILTDDPVGVEGYWHRRFQEYRGNGEWFKLPASAISSFKKWTKIA